MLTLLPLPSPLVDKIWPPRICAALPRANSVDGALVVILEEYAGLKQGGWQYTHPTKGQSRELVREVDLYTCIGSLHDH